MKLTFSRKELEALIEWQKENGSTLKAPYTDEKIQPSLVMVGDHGVYFMNYSDKSNPIVEGESSQHVAYAREVNPLTMEFDEWWDMKRESWGADDGVIPIPIKLIEHYFKVHSKAKYFPVNTTPEGIEISC